jgi:hypothetical protein
MLLVPGFRRLVSLGKSFRGNARLSTQELRQILQGEARIGGPPPEQETRPRQENSTQVRSMFGHVQSSSVSSPPSTTRPRKSKDKCDYTTYQSNNLTRHKRAVHNGIKTKFKIVECPLCAVQLSETDVARHIRHNCPFGPEVKVGCRFCERTYSNEESRDDHEYAYHHMFRPWCCKKCGNTYSYRAQVSNCCCKM